MIEDGLCEADIEAVQKHLTILRVSQLIPTEAHILRTTIENAAAPLGSWLMPKTSSPVALVIMREVHHTPIERNRFAHRSALRHRPEASNVISRLLQAGHFPGQASYG
jgi:hypothetical protein